MHEIESPKNFCNIQLNSKTLCKKKKNFFFDLTIYNITNYVLLSARNSSFRPPQSIFYENMCFLVLSGNPIKYLRNAFTQRFMKHHNCVLHYSTVDFCTPLTSPLNFTKLIGQSRVAKPHTLEYSIVHK